MTPTVGIIGTRGYPSFYGGFETLIRHLAPYLVDHGWNVVVYGRGSTFSNDSERDLRVRSIKTPGIDKKSVSTLTFGCTSTLHAAATKPDVALILNVANGFWLPLLKMRGIPTVVNVDGIEWEREKWGFSARTVFKAGAKLTGMYADELIYDSHELGIKWQQRCGRSGTFIPYGGTPRPAGDVVDGLSRRKYVLMVARFVPENTIEPFLSAAKVLSEKWDVVIVGSTGYGGEMDRRVEQLADTNPHVRWYGHVNNDDMLFSLWENAGVYFHGHSVGGTNPALVQAMACGAPIVARDTVFNREVLQHSGIFVRPDAASILGAIDELISDVQRQEELSASATHRAKDFYSWEQVCSQYDIALQKHLRTQHITTIDGELAAS